MADHTGDITCIASSSSSSTNTGQVYDVFLNHRGPDTKKGLASHIYRRLIVRGLNVFLDQPELRKGENFQHQIEQAIRTASVQVAIFSPTYAQSTWCLNELAQMVESESESESKSTIIPVFLDVDPSELRWTQSGDGVESIIRCICPCLLGEKGQYARDLHMLQKKTTLDPHTNKKKPRHDSSTLQKWRNALSVVSNKSGFVINAYNGDEGQLVDAVVEEVWRKVSKTPLNVAKYPTGLDERIEHVERIVLLQQQSQKTRVVGIVGLGGVGKTTLAKEFFNRYTSNYDRCCFLSDVRETAAKSSLSSLQTALLKDLAHLQNEQIRDIHEGIGKLRKHLSSRPQCLIVLDDVDHIDQLDALFSPVKDTIQSSSLILVTSRKRDVLRSAGIIEDSIYPQTGLNRQHSRALFCSHAFDQSCPMPEFEQLVEEFLEFCDGLPLSLKVVGAAIRGEDSQFWKSQLNKIRRILPEDIHRKLKISFDGLDKEEQEIFLDVACFFIGENRDTAIAIWNGSGWDGWLGLRILENRCLVEIDSEECIRMHDHLRDLGRDVAEKEHPLRLWRPNVNLPRTLSPLSPVRGITMDYGDGHEQFFENVAGNCNLSRLELLRGEGSFVESVFRAGELRQLIYLQWENCPISSLSFTGKTRNLRVLYIQGEELNALWQHESEAPLQLTQLYIDAPLSEVPQSIGKLNQLERIVLENGYFETLPNEFADMHSLKHLNFSSCEILQRLPDSVGQLTGLQSLNLEGCSSLQELRDSVGQLTGLQSLNLEGCSSLQGLPDSVGQLTGLQSLNLEGCSSLQGLPGLVGQLTGLQSLNLEGCYSLQGLPGSVEQPLWQQLARLAHLWPQLLLLPLWQQLLPQQPLPRQPQLQLPMLQQQLRQLPQQLQQQPQQLLRQLEPQLPLSPQPPQQPQLLQQLLLQLQQQLPQQRQRQLPQLRQLLRPHMQLPQLQQLLPQMLQLLQQQRPHLLPQLLPQLLQLLQQQELLQLLPQQPQLLPQMLQLQQRQEEEWEQQEQWEQQQLEQWEQWEQQQWEEEEQQQWEQQQQQQWEQRQQQREQQQERLLLQQQQLLLQSRQRLLQQQLQRRLQWQLQRRLQRRRPWQQQWRQQWPLMPPQFTDFILDL